MPRNRQTAPPVTCRSKQRFVASGFCESCQSVTYRATPAGGAFHDTHMKRNGTERNRRAHSNRIKERARHARSAMSNRVDKNQKQTDSQILPVKASERGRDERERESKVYLLDKIQLLRIYLSRTYDELIAACLSKFVGSALHCCVQ